jgi:hypothetical protein
MPSRLTAPQIETSCRQLLINQRRVGVRDVMEDLRNRHGLCGRTARVAGILRRVEQDLNQPKIPAGNGSAEIALLRQQLRAAEHRAQRAEELERSHQDFWAKRYAEKVDELERRNAAAPSRAGVITSEQYLRIHQRAAELARRLAKYEAVEPFRQADAGEVVGKTPGLVSISATVLEEPLC